MLNKFRGTLLGAVVGDCIGGIQETMSLPIPFAEVASRSDPLSLRSKLVRSGDRHIFRYSADTLAIFSASRTLMKVRSGEIDPSNIELEFRSNLFAALQRRSGVFKAPSTGVLAAEIEHGNSFDPSKYNFQGNCSVVRAIPCGLLDPAMAPRLAAATHTHASASDYSRYLAGMIQDTMYSKSPTLSKNSSPLTIAQALASLKAEDEEEGTEIQEAFARRIGKNASASVAVAAGYFGFLKALKLSLEDAPKFEFPKHLKELRAEDRPVNLMGNSNRLDSSRALDRESAFAYKESPVAVAINWAVSLGGDTRTNACIAGALAGGFWGEQEIPDVWRMFCEGTTEAVEISDLLHGLKKEVEHEVGENSETLGTVQHHKLH